MTTDNSVMKAEVGPNNVPTLISFTTNSEEMLRIDEDGFYVRGVKVKSSMKDAELIYSTFKQWLTWATLTRNY